MNYLNNIQLTLGLLIPLFIGIFLYKKGIVDKNFPKGLSGYLFNIALPCSILDSMCSDISFNELIKSFRLPLICIIIILFSFILAKLVARFVTKDVKKRRLMEFAFMFPNFTFTAYPLLESFYGKESIFYASIFNIAMFFGSLTIGVYVIKKAGGMEDVKFRFRDLLTPPLISLFIGMLLLVLPFKLPTFLTTSIEMIGETTAPLGILLSGIIIARENSFNIKDVSSYVASFARLILIPIMVIYVLKLFGQTEYMLYVPAIIIANPIAVNAVMLSENYGAPSAIAANQVVISSVLAIVTIPLIQMLI